MGRQLKIGEDIYEIPTEHAAAITEHLVYAYGKLGKPEDPLSESGKKMMDVILATWEDTYPFEYYEWKSIRDEYKDNELDIHDQVKQGTGRNLAAYPMYVLQVMKRIFPNWDPIKRENCMALVREYPIFRMCNRV